MQSDSGHTKKRKRGNLPEVSAPKSPNIGRLTERRKDEGMANTSEASSTHTKNSAHLFIHILTPTDVILSPSSVLGTVEFPIDAVVCQRAAKLVQVVAGRGGRLVQPAPGGCAHDGPWVKICDERASYFVAVYLTDKHMCQMNQFSTNRASKAMQLAAGGGRKKKEEEDAPIEASADLPAKDCSPMDSDDDLHVYDDDDHVMVIDDGEEEGYQSATASEDYDALISITSVASGTKRASVDPAAAKDDGDLGTEQFCAISKKQRQNGQVDETECTSGGTQDSSLVGSTIGASVSNALTEIEDENDIENDWALCTRFGVELAVGLGGIDVPNESICNASSPNMAVESTLPLPPLPPLPHLPPQPSLGGSVSADDPDFAEDFPLLDDQESTAEEGIEVSHPSAGIGDSGAEDISAQIARFHEVTRNMKQLDADATTLEEFIPPPKEIFRSTEEQLEKYFSPALSCYDADADSSAKYLKRLERIQSDDRSRSLLEKLYPDCDDFSDLSALAEKLPVLFSQHE